MKLGLGIICKDEVEQVEHILKEYGKLFDEIQITVTNPSKKQELFDTILKYKANPSYYDWKEEKDLLEYRGKKLFPFDKARNYNMQQFKEAEYYVRLDTDDTIVNPQNLRALAERAKESKISLVYCWYNYSRDQYGAVDAAHFRETIVKVSPKIYWNKAIHENILPLVQIDFQLYVDTAREVSIYHNTSYEKLCQSNKRNIKYLLAEYHKEKDHTDPRTIAYLGRTFAGMRKYDLAKQFLEEHVSRSGWDEDRYQSWCQIAYVLMQFGNYEQAIAACNEAIHERPEYPEAYLELHDIYFNKGSWKKSIEFGVMGLGKPIPTTFTMIDPSRYGWRTYASLALCSYNLNDIISARKYLQEAKRSIQDPKAFAYVEELISKAEEQQEFVKNFVGMSNYLKAVKPENLEYLFYSLPDGIKQLPVIKSFTKSFLPPKKWRDNSIVFCCPPVFEPWSPRSVDTGIGGSEEAVIHLAKEFTKMGYDVTVYNYCDTQAGIYDGVTYIDFSEFNIRDEFNYLIQWRTNLHHANVKAKQNWVWMHDIVLPDIVYVPEDISKVDKIVVLSRFHRGQLPSFVPEEKILVSANGLNLPDYADSSVERNQYKIVYGSSYDRGLEYLLNVWPDIKTAVPEAELHIFYGWQNLIKVAETEQDIKKFIYKIDGLMKQPGIYHKKRLSHKDVIKEYQSAGIWAYPCDFPEISCITAMKAQVCGAIPVVTSYAALAETVKFGVIVGEDIKQPEILVKFKEALIDLLKDHEKQDKLRRKLLARQYEFDWKKVAEQWNQVLHGLPVTSQFITQ